MRCNHARPVALLVLAAILAVVLVPATLVRGKEMLPTPADEPVLGELEPVLVDALLGDDADRDGSLAKVCDNAAIRAQVAKHNLKLFGGPMLGCLTDRSVRVWVRTPAEAEIQVVVGSGPQLADPIRSSVVKTRKEVDLTALVDIDGLRPLTVYHYDVLVDGKSA
ncbi:MAG TPA: hypothetical protein VE890_06210, partial [Thermoguttaceae bacterium]|nr:hypothetical protein [Thermoguttaceae bacterium]